MSAMPAAPAVPALTLITGGAGFVATNVADRLLRAGGRVRVFDNLSRAGVERNLRWLRDQHGAGVELHYGDVRDSAALSTAVRGVDAVFHFAAQVAVTTSLDDPLADFDVNARGTLTLLEVMRRTGSRASLLFTSTNKVYGDLADVPLRVVDDRYAPVDAAIAASGIAEDRGLDFHSPYGCSKGAADQYVLDYARTFGLRGTVFRMSCIYGPHQFGTEDQGWVAHFARQALDEQRLTLYGDGRQVRDVLFVEDLVDAMLLAHQHASTLAGQAFNIGGGPRNTVSLLELLALLRDVTGRRTPYTLEPWRSADQRYYVSDIRRFGALTGWAPRVRIADGLSRLLSWLSGETAAHAGTLQRVAS